MTGANKGIGKEIAKGLAQKGFHVLIGARNKEYGEAAVADLAECGKVSFHLLDVTNPTSVAAAADAIKSQFGHLDVLVSLIYHCSAQLAEQLSAASVCGTDQLQKVC